MKVLHLTGEREDMGGILSVLRNVQSATNPSECQHAVCVHHTYIERRHPALDYRFSRYICGDAPSHAYILWQSIRTYFELSRLMDREPFDIVHAHTRGGLLVVLGLLKRRGLPVVFTNHAYARRRGLYQWAGNRRGLSTVVLTPNMARHYGLAENPPHVCIVSDCCADSFFEQPLAAERLSGQGKKLQIAGVGNIMRWKNWHLLVRALVRLSDVERAQIEFSLWGPTPEDPDSQAYDKELRELVRTAGVHDTFLFRGSTNDIVGVLKKADWFMLTSTNEPCSVALIEALALGLPVLVSASGGNLDIVDRGRTGLLFEPDNPDDLAAQLRKILQGGVQLVSAAQRRESVRQRSGSRVATQYLTLYRCLLERKASPGPWGKS